MHPKDLPEQFYIDLAVGVSTFEDICRMYQVEQADVEAIEDDPEFNQRFLLAQQAVMDNGEAFQARCRRIVNKTVVTMERLIIDPDIPASTRLEAFKTLTSYGKLEPAKANEGGPVGPQLVFNILAPDGTSLIEQPIGPTPVLEQAADQDIEEAELIEYPAVPASLAQAFF